MDELAASPLSSCANELRLQGEFSDIVLKVGRRSFSCHRIMLASASKYFLNALTKNYKETGKDVIELKHFNADDFELLLTHIYGGHLCLNDDKAYRLLRLSIYLSVKTLEELCTKYLIESCSMPSKTALRTFVFAFRTQSVELLDVFTKRIAENFVSWSKNHLFYHLPGEELLKVLTHAKLNADTPVILNFLVDWMKFQSAGDGGSLASLPSTVDKTKISNEWLIEKVKQSTMASKNKSLNDDEKAEEGETDSNIVADIFEEVAFLREIDDIEFHQVNLPFTLYLGGTRGDEGKKSSINVCKLESPNNLRTSIIDSHQCSDKTIELCKAATVNNVPFMLTIQHYSQPTTAEYDFCFTSSNYDRCGELYDSYHHEDYSYSVPNKAVLWPYLFHESKIHSLSPLKIIGELNSSDARIAVINDEVFVYNGRDSFFAFDCQNSKWSDEIVIDGFTETAKSDFLAHQNCLYIIGGQVADSQNLCEGNGKLFQQFDKREGKWLQLPQMENVHHRAASCVYKDVLYVSGGSNLSYFKGSIECFDFKAGKWGLLETSMAKPKMNHTVIAYEDQLWFFGGQNYKSNGYGVVSDLTWCSYDLKEDKWSDIFSVPEIFGDFKTREIFDVVLRV